MVNSTEYGATECTLDLGVQPIPAKSSGWKLLTLAATATMVCVGVMTLSGSSSANQLWAQTLTTPASSVRLTPGFTSAPVQARQHMPAGPVDNRASGLYPADQASATQLGSVSAPFDLASLAPAAGSGIAGWYPLAGVASSVALIAYIIKKILDTPSRTYNPNDVNVGKEYDAWTEEGVLEYYWGEHIHLGYYSPELRKRGNYTNMEFIKAKIDFVTEMFKWSNSKTPTNVLDVGCGIGGTSRLLAERFPDAQVTGITLSPKQVERGTELAKERGITNARFQVMDALAMDFPDNSFDLVWACESGEHMPDKKKYVEEMTRVLKPGGSIVIATWCQREETPENPLTKSDKDRLQFLYDEWVHPYFISKEEYVRLMEGTGVLSKVESANWNDQTIDSWRHSIWVGIRDPMGLFCKGPWTLYKCLRDAITLERMHRAFACGLMEYGMIRAVKKTPVTIV